MDNPQSQVLIRKYLQGTATPEEEALLESWYDEIALSRLEPEGKPDYEKVGLEILNALRKEQIVIKPIRLWPRFAAAASIILFIIAGLFYYDSNQREKHNQNELLSGKEILPGGNKAVLTLANGRKIILNNANKGNILNIGGLSINKSQEGQIAYQPNGKPDAGNELKYNTVNTPKGGQWHITLSDGTEVWMNAASELTYPQTFGGVERVVTLKGEAYFEVAKDKSHPFIVKSDRQEVKVFGTHFNINTYDDEPYVKTTLLEGSVAVSGVNGDGPKMLVPGDGAFNDGKSILVREVNTEADVSWKNGYFSFKRADIKTVMRQFSRWYNIDVAYEGAVPDVELTGRAGRNVNASQALKILSYFNIHYKIDGNRIKVTQ
jgi:transmembrane sensor